MSAEKPRRLGRGLEALLARASEPATPAERSSLQTLAIASIRPNPYQPRKEFRPEDLADLEASLKASGLLQPVTVRKAGDGYELIAGERRLRAATRLGWAEIPAIVREIDDRTLLTLAIVENLQRVDLNPIEEAEGYRQLMDEFGLTQQQVADAVGKDRSTVANLLRLLGLPREVLTMVQQGHLSSGHARALLGLDEEREIVALAQEAVARQLSVREVERRVRGEPEPIAPGARPAGSKPTGTGAAPNGEPAPNPELRRLEDLLRRRYQTDVQLTTSGGEKGTLKLSFYSADDLDRILDLMLGAERHAL